MACTNSVDIYILWWIVKNKRSSSGLVDRAARMPEVLYLPWCLASYPPLHRSPPTPVSRWPACCPQCTSTQPELRAPQYALGKAWAAKGTRSLSRLYWIFLNGLTSAHAALKYWTGRTFKYRKTCRLEMIAPYIIYSSYDHILEGVLFCFAFFKLNIPFLFIGKKWLSSVPPQQGIIQMQQINMEYCHICDLIYRSFVFLWSFCYDCC